MWRILRTLVTTGRYRNRCLAIFGITSVILGTCANFGLLLTWIIILVLKEDVVQYYGCAFMALCLAFIGCVAVYCAIMSHPQLCILTVNNDLKFVTFENETPTPSANNPDIDIPILLSGNDENTQNSGVRHVNININNKRYSIMDAEEDFSAIIFKTPKRRNSRNQENKKSEVPKMRSFKKSEIQTYDHHPVQVSQSLTSELRAEGYFLDETSRLHGQAVRSNSQGRR